MKLIYAIFVVLILNSCYESNEEHYRKYLENYEKNVPHYRAYRKEMLAFSKKQVGEEEYNKVYQQFLDTIDTWAELGVRSFTKDTNRIRQKLDELICFNNAKDKLIGGMLYAGVNRKNLGGGIEYMCGAKVEGNWYFWSSSNQAVSKEMNSDLKKGKPISFFQLENYCVEQVLGGYMTKDRQMNHKWFDGLFLGGYQFKDRYESRLHLNGFKIDDEQEYWNYVWKESGIIYRIIKAQNDSIAKYVQRHPPTKEWRRMNLNDTIDTDVRVSIKEYIEYKCMLAITKHPNQTVWNEK